MTKNTACKINNITHTKCTTNNKEGSTNIAPTTLTRIRWTLTTWTNISTKCMGRSTTSNVHAILGTNFWVQRGPKHGYIKHRATFWPSGVHLYPKYGVYKTVYVCTTSTTPY
ncbi:hypothetical protein PFUGPA_05935 [Plasmodium falciparum Palo Alto/Uganda]|uniref:Uncharacterized protein n=1 Tax=Plasmodium falciparum (isolate Palo Alto / Uganda) TaxID=57270 RepID=W4IQQ3_PLAFP|nr:hypothetical protein PFUGPA_05935 [Plasmodium falciparum Palo Alto/Uganda]